MVVRRDCDEDGGMGIQIYKAGGAGIGVSEGTNSGHGRVTGEDHSLNSGMDGRMGGGMSRVKACSICPLPVLRPIGRFPNDRSRVK